MNTNQDLVGISVVFSTAHNNASLIVNTVKEKNSKTIVVCGGNHPTFAYKRMFKDCPNIDFIFMYEGDNTFPLFLKYLQGKVSFKDPVSEKYRRNCKRRILFKF